MATRSVSWLAQPRIAHTPGSGFPAQWPPRRTRPTAPARRSADQLLAPSRPVATTAPAARRAAGELFAQLFCFPAAASAVPRLPRPPRRRSVLLRSQRTLWPRRWAGRVPRSATTKNSLQQAAPAAAPAAARLDRPAGGVQCSSTVCARFDRAVRRCMWSVTRFLWQTASACTNDWCALCLPRTAAPLPQQW